MENKRVLSFDAETNGLWGQAFAIGAILYAPNGEEVDRFVGRCPIEETVNPWVAENVLPQMAGIPENYPDYPSLLQAFMTWRASAKADATELVHMGLPVEARLFLDAHNMGILGDWDAPYPLVDVAAIPDIGTSVDTYNQAFNCGPNAETFVGGTHNPLYDSAAAACAYMHWLWNYEG